MKNHFLRWSTEGFVLNKAKLWGENILIGTQEAKNFDGKRYTDVLGPWYWGDSTDDHWSLENPNEIDRKSGSRDGNLKSHQVILQVLEVEVA